MVLNSAIADLNKASTLSAGADICLYRECHAAAGVNCRHNIIGRLCATIVIFNHLSPARTPVPGILRGRYRGCHQ